MIEISVFKYDNPSLFLRDVWSKKRAFNKNFTLGAWAKQLGISSCGTFHQIVNGNRPIPKKYVAAISESLSLDAKESLYLETLVDYKKSKSIKMKEHYAQRLKSLAPGKKLSVFEIESFHFLKNPLNGAIVEMTALEGFRADAIWIKERLRINVSIAEIKEALERLLDLNLLHVDGNGNLKRTHKIFYSKQDIQNQALREYHKNIMKLASEEIEKQDVKEREFGACVFGIKKTSLPAIKDDIRDFIKELMAKYETAEEEAEEIYQFATQFFGMTNKQEKLQ